MIDPPVSDASFISTPKGRLYSPRPGELPAAMTVAVAGAYRMRMANPSDGTAVEDSLRPTDRVDLAATTDDGPAAIVLRNLIRSQPVIAFDYQAECVAVGGVVDRLPQGDAVIWLLCTSDFDGALRGGGLRLVKPWLRLMVGSRRRLFNIVPEANVASVRWLNWLGFRAVRRHPNFHNRGADCVEMRLELRSAAQ